MNNSSCGILNEFKDINFKDKRLNERFFDIMQTLEKSPSGVVSKAFVDANDQKAAYRFIENEKTGFQIMLNSHQGRVKERCYNHDYILAIHDSTSLLLQGAKNVPDIGKIGNLKQNHPGLNIHASLLMTPQAEILGLSDLQLFNRRLTIKNGKNHVHNNLPAEYKETGKWLRSISHTRKQIGTKAKLVWIADREGDFWDYFSRLDEMKELFVQRVVHERKINESKNDYFSYLRQQPVMGHYIFEIDSRGGQYKRNKRTVNCEIRSAEITLKKPNNLKREMCTFKVQAIHVVEKTEKNPLEWFLITNIPSYTLDEVLEKVRWYHMRWTIEELFRIVKSGCGVEEMRLETRDRLMKYLLLLFIVAMRILWMTKLAKEKEDLPCTEAFSEEEWKVLYIRKYKKPPPPNHTPTIKEAVRLLGILGGFYEYNKKNYPGVMTIWRGMRRLKELFINLESLQILFKERP